MANLGNQFISASYQSVLNVGTGSGAFLSATNQRVTDGYGTQAPLSLSTTGVTLHSTLTVSGSIIPAVSNSVDIGSPTRPFRHLYVGSGSVYLDDHQVLSLNVAGTDTTLAAPTSGSLNFVNDIVFKSDEGLGTDSGGKFTMAGGGPNDATQTLYSGSQHYVQVDGQLVYNNYVTDQAGNPVPGITGSINFDIADSTISTYLENAQRFTIGTAESNILNQLYGNEGQTGHTIDHEIWTTDTGSATVRVSRIAQDQSGVQMIINDTAQPLSSSVIGVSVGDARMTANFVTAQGYDKVTIQYGSGSNPAHFNNNQVNVIGNTKFTNNVDVTGSLKVNGGITGSLQGTASNATTLNNTGSAVFATTGSNTFNGSQTISGSLNVTGSITALSASITYLQTIYQTSSVIFTSGSNILGDEASDVQTLNGRVDIPLGNLNVTGATTSSLGFFGNLQGTASFASNALSASQAENSVSASQAQNAVSASQADNANLLDGKDSSEFATTGSNNFIGVENITGSLNVSGSQSITQNLRMYASSSYGNATVQPGAYVTESAPVSQSNIYFSQAGTNGQVSPPANLTGSIMVSGSNNIFFTSNRANTFITQGTLGYIGGNNNLIQTVPSITTSSLIYPTTAGNYFQGVVNFGFTTSSLTTVFAPFITNNNFAALTNINHQSGSIDMSSNIVYGQFTSTQNQTQGKANAVVGNNVIGGATVLNHISSSITFNNNFAGGITVNNLVSSSFTTANNGISVNRNIFGGTGNVIYTTGSMSTSTQRFFTDNVIVGRNNIVSSSVNGGNSSNLLSTAVIGQDLFVSGTHGTGVGGSSFFGRYNDTGSLAISQDIVFAVGSGFGAANRRTSMWITSGSLVGVSGSLNVIGNGPNILNVTGGLNVSGSSNAIAGGLTLTQGNVNISGSQLNTNNFITYNGSPNDAGPMDNFVGHFMVNRKSFVFNNIVQAQLSSGSNFTITTDVTNSFSTINFSSAYGGKNANFGIANYNGSRIIEGIADEFKITGSLITSGSNHSITGSLGVYGKTFMSSSDAFPLYVSGTIQTQRLHFDGNPFNTNPSSNLGAIRIDGSNQSFYSTMYDLANITTQSLVGQTVITGSNLVKTSLQSSNGGTDAYVDLINSAGTRTLDVKVDAAVITGSLNVTGSVTIANAGDLTMYGHKMFNAAEFWSNTTQSGSAGVSGSLTFDASGSAVGISLVSGSRLTVANGGTYNIQFSAQFETSAGSDTGYVWFKKNGNNIADSATKVVLANNTAQVMTVNILDEAAANDYYELGYQLTNGNATILAEAASGNIPAIPSVIATVTQAR